MARDVTIVTKPGSAKVILDGVEIEKLMSYSIEESKDGAFLTFTFFIEESMSLNVSI